MRNIYKSILYITLTLLILSACDREDDIDEIFTGKTWYMNGARISGKKLNSEISNFYTAAGKNAYYISFSSKTFKGSLSEGADFSGTWSANGKKQTVKLNITSAPTLSNQFDKDIYKIISSITAYQSGSDFLWLKKNSDNYVMFGNSRTKVYN